MPRDAGLPGLDRLPVEVGVAFIRSCRGRTRGWMQIGYGIEPVPVVANVGAGKRSKTG